MDFDTFFKTALAADIGPYPYQARLATEPWPVLINIPTGMGKTAAVILAWLYKRCLTQKPAPRRLIYCLPMRVLVQQTCLNAKAWIDNLVSAWVIPLEKKPEVAILMGGEMERDWDFQPEKELILVGTQDQLLSRAMNRGYAMSRFRWPVHFALLNNDSLWVMDETQLMGVALKTTAQLQAFREGLKTWGEVQSVWMSATLDEKSLNTVDHRQPEAGWPGLSLSQEEMALPGIEKRLRARKRLFRAETRLGEDESAYARALAAEILEKHRPGHLTLAVLNRVSRAQQVYRSLVEAGRTTEDTGLIHSRFREPDRRRREELLFGAGDRIIVATQTIEAGVDVSARVLFTEPAPWASMVQRFGRLNRYGEHPESTAYWISLSNAKELQESLQKDRLSPDKAQKKAAQIIENLSIPYALPLLEESGGILADLAAVDIRALQEVHYTEPETIQPVIRRKDIVDLFDTAADLSGSDVDISRYIRDQENTDVQVFWREFEEETPAGEQPAPTREELCAVSLAGIREFLRKKEVTAWRWDHLDGVWQRTSSYETLPGMVLLLKAAAGGYEPFLGWTGRPAQAGHKVPPVETQTRSDNEGMEEGYQVPASRWLTIAQHAQDVAAMCQSLLAALEVPEEFHEPLTTAAWWHDVGKAHEQFQMVLARLDGFQPGGLWAKAGGGPADRKEAITLYEVIPKRRGFRHELASALAWLQQARPDHPGKDLIAYLIASHHGKVRLRLRSLPGETKPTDPELPFACGVWQGDRLPGVNLGDGQASAELNLDLSPMMLGEGALGSSWLHRMTSLREALGPFRLAYLEALLRIADWRASAAE